MCDILDFEWKYGEGEVLEQLTKHLKGSYESHYSNERNDVQTLDIFEARGTLSDTSIDNAIKYLMRYGKKAGRNKKDLLKAMHYLVLATAYDEKNGMYSKTQKTFEDFKSDPIAKDVLDIKLQSGEIVSAEEEEQAQHFLLKTYTNQTGKIY